ncbi:helix-turn-helix transcriptional regulator [Proteiniclasticum ruminis]|uniref:Tetratricopeptide repeat-containing protein n=1 Tax=Proteiniclasticum ruminis TaxID=398199 RepID=A0A1I4ZRA6_9CLOT|nr:helix-turn-helix transcriptional regulator [Proteiniclasticum ruminis]SFN52806.1 Tetratricopeptide repeat-containing protein [Proteiniclasticum ruminis]
MEILSTGEKIRRARVQKGMTLKALCGSEISVSKMSTIENDKVQAEEWILELVAKRLGIEKESLKKDLVEEVTEELHRLAQNMFTKNYERDIRSLIKVSEENHLIYQAFIGRIQLVEHFIEKNKQEELNIEVSQLYKTYINIVNQETQYLYCITMAKYLDVMSEYDNALVFLNFLMSHYYTLPDQITKEQRLLIPYYTVKCHLYLEEFEEAKKYLHYLEELLTVTEDESLKGQIMLYMCMANAKDDLKECSLKIKDFMADYPVLHAKAKYMLSIRLLNRGEIDASYQEMEEAVRMLGPENMAENIELVLHAMDTFVTKGHIKEASKYIDLVVNAAIENQNAQCVEKAYYFKGLLLAENGNFNMAETYLSVSLDMLLKRGKTQELAKRYHNLAEVYYKMDKKEEAIRYFALSIQIEGHI